MSHSKTRIEKANGSDQAAKRNDAVKIIRRGAIAASIWKRQTSTGFEYLDFSLSRSWKTKAGDKEGYSQNFFPGNEEALQAVIAEACEFIRRHLLADGPRDGTTTGDSARNAA